MPHRADQIMTAAVVALEARTAPGWTIYPHLSLSLSEADGELPAVAVTYGDDSPAGSFTRLLYSELDLRLTAYEVGETEQEVRVALLELRAEIHRALMTDSRLGLSFVHQINYGGAEAPRLNPGEQIVGSLTSVFRIRYEMNLDDPS